MAILKPVSIPIPDSAPDDPRLGQLLGKNLENNESPACVILGFPSDEGVQRNGGRKGAALAPAEIRKALYKLTPDAESSQTFSDLMGKTIDAGDLEVSDRLGSDQKALAKVIAGYLEQGITPIILGGGHETAFGHFLGYAEAGLKTSIFNLDAHTDVRQLKNNRPHSGSPFRQALEHESKSCEKYLVAGLQPHSVAKAHLEYIDKKNGSYLLRDETNITSISGLLHEHSSEHLMVTFDMDAVDQAYAPGVSAPCTNGLPSDLWLTGAYLAGRNEKVSSFDLSEVNPNYDRDGQTARLAALTIWHFLLGLSQRD